jgi:hypothetical protein
MSELKIVHQNLPTVGEPGYQVEGHVLDAVTGPWLVHLILHRIKKGRGSIGLGRNELAALLKFVSEHDPDMYSRMGVAGHRARVDKMTKEA